MTAFGTDEKSEYSSSNLIEWKINESVGVRFNKHHVEFITFPALAIDVYSVFFSLIDSLSSLSYCRSIAFLNNR